MIIDLFSNEKAPCKHDKLLIDEIHKVTLDMRISAHNFNEATDASEIDYHIFRLKELEAKYFCLLKQAKLDKICSSEIAGEVLR